MIKNCKGVDLLGKNHYDRNRLGNKISLVVSNNGIPLSISLTTANVHDIHEVIPTLDNLPFKTKKFTLIADKAYLSNNLKSVMKDRKIQLITCYKRNQKTKNTRKQIDLLQKRFIVENVFSWLQNYRRLRIRYEKNYSTFIQFYYFGLSELIARKINKL